LGENGKRKFQVLIIPGGEPNKWFISPESAGRGITLEASLPPVAYLMVIGGRSLIPNEGQSLDIIGWYPNGTAAIGIMPYGAVA